MGECGLRSVVNGKGCKKNKTFLARHPPFVYTDRPFSRSRVDSTRSRGSRFETGWSADEECRGSRMKSVCL